MGKDGNFGQAIHVINTLLNQWIVENTKFMRPSNAPIRNSLGWMVIGQEARYFSGILQLFTYPIDWY